MDIKRMDLSDETLVNVVNEYGGRATFQTDFGIRRFEADESKEIPLKELKQLILQMNQGGLFRKNFLVIKDERVREMFNLDPLSQYNLDAAGMKALLESKDEAKIEEFLQYTSDENLEKIVRVAVEMPVTDLRTLNLLHGYSGRNVINSIKEREETQAKETGVRKRVDGVAPKEAATPLRGRKIPEK